MDRFFSERHNGVKGIFFFKGGGVKSGQLLFVYKPASWASLWSCAEPTQHPVVRKLEVYRCYTRTPYRRHLKRLERFHMRSLRSILKTSARRTGSQIWTSWKGQSAVKSPFSMDGTMTCHQEPFLAIPETGACIVRSFSKSILQSTLKGERCCG